MSNENGTMGVADKRRLQDNYAAFSKILGTWLVTYGIAFLAFVASQESISIALKSDPHSSRIIIICILIGLASQVLSTFLYKGILAYLAHGEIQETFKQSRVYKVCDKIYYAYWFEGLTDIVTLVVYFYATYVLSTIVLGSA